MESTLLRPATALLPSVRARRIGSGMLSLAAFPGHDVGVLGGRRVGTTGYGRVRLSILQGMGGSRGKAARSGSGVEGDGASESDDPMEFVTRLEIKLKEFSTLQFSLAPESLTPKQSHGQEILRAIGSASCDLVLEVVVRFNPTSDSPLFTELLDIACIFSRVTDSKMLYGVSTTLVRALDDLRRVVSNASQVILPAEVMEAYGDPMDSGDDEMIAVVIIVYKRVLADLRYILDSMPLAPVR